MRDNYRISHKELEEKKITIHKTDDMDEEDEVFIGNSRAREILEFGLDIKSLGYNIYLSTESGYHIVEFLTKFLEAKENNKEKKATDDWCYVQNFQNKNKPKIISLPCGKGKEFKEIIESCTKEVVKQTINIFDSTDFQNKESELKDDFLTKGEEKLEKLKEDAKKLGFYTNITEKGIFFIPVFNEKKISEDDYDELTVEEQETILNNLKLIEEESEEIMIQVKKLKDLSEVKVDKYENEVLQNIVEENFIKVEEAFKSRIEVIEYIKELREDLMESLKNNIVVNDAKERTINLSLTDEDDEEFFDDYKVNLFVDHSVTNGCPIVHSRNATYYELFGKIEYSNEIGIYETDYTMIKKGMVHEANGGYLIINMENILNSSLSWENLKKILYTRQLVFENVRELFGALPIKTIEPEPIPLDLKVILIGNEFLYRILCSYDKEFNELFKIHVEFNDSVNKDKKVIKQYYNFFDSTCKSNNYKLLTNGAKFQLIKYASKIACHRNKLTTEFDRLIDIISEADLWASNAENKVIDEDIIKKTIDNKEKRNYLVKENIEELYEKKKLLVDIKGSKIGQINGVAVSDFGDFSIGRIIRITAVTFKGKMGVINIEKENKMSGRIFDKGIGILSGYIGARYSQEYPMMLNCQLCFEQVYNTIDGDSASCAELYAILSSLAEVPIKQSIAITGSVDQFGNVQPIGSVSNKIEGCYNIFKSQGLTGEQGIIIPKQNVDEIIIDDQILKDVKNGKFNLYAIERIEEGIEILTDTTMEKIDNLIKKKIRGYYLKENKKL